MVTAITPTAPSATLSGSPTPTGTHRLIILHVEHDGDDVLVEFANRVTAGDRVTLANLRPTVPATLPPGGIASDLGMMIHLESSNAQFDHERILDRRIAARSRLLDEYGLDHESLTETYHRSVVGRVTARSLRKAIGRIARHARADEIVVGPGAILECLRMD